MDKISVIIPVKTRKRRSSNVLRRSFLNHSSRGVIMVDGHSTDRTVAWVREFQVKIFYEEYHARAGACQIGAFL